MTSSWVLAGASGWLLAGRALRPLQRITATARRVAGKSLHERIALDGPDDEIKELAETFDAMLDRLDRAFDGQRRFAANASHELRTPLTLNRTMIEVALDAPGSPQVSPQLGARLLAVNERHERLIDGLLVLASSEQHPGEHSRVDLAEIARQAIVMAGDAAGAAGVEIRATLAPAPVRGDAVLLERLALNLIDNAVRYNVTECGWVAIATGTRDGYSELVVQNTGPTVPENEIDGLFEPFRRLASAEHLSVNGHAATTRGAGLGLSIVRAVANAHQGEVHAASLPGGGLAVHVRIAS